MEQHYYLDIIRDTSQVVKGARPDSLATFVRAERTPGEVAVSDIRGRAGERAATLSEKTIARERNLSPGISQTNSRPGVFGEVFSIIGAGPFEGPPDPGGGSWRDCPGGVFPIILELLAKRSEAYFEGLERDCPAGIITGSCGNGHRFAKEVYCGREWCEVCNGKWNQDKTLKPPGVLPGGIQRLSNLPG
ncbi:hypothetical protein ES705_34514 [subsurface metagenome]